MGSDPLFRYLQFVYRWWFILGIFVLTFDYEHSWWLFYTVVTFDLLLLVTCSGLIIEWLERLFGDLFRRCCLLLFYIRCYWITFLTILPFGLIYIGNMPLLEYILPVVLLVVFCSITTVRCLFYRTYPVLPGCSRLFHCRWWTICGTIRLFDIVRCVIAICRLSLILYGYVVRWYGCSSAVICWWRYIDAIAICGEFRFVQCRFRSWCLFFVPPLPVFLLYRFLLVCSGALPLPGDTVTVLFCCLFDLPVV